MTERATAVVSAGAAALLLAASAAAGEVVRVQPGLWQSTTTVKSAFMPSLPPRTSTECIRQAEYDVDKQLRDHGGCTITDKVVAGPTMRWTMTCSPAGGPVATGEGELTSEATRVDGRMRLTVRIQGQPLTTHVTWTARRLGDC
ncbi:MAG: DUF3617 domain-containing protein [Rhodospirillales bacterium]